MASSQAMKCTLKRFMVGWHSAIPSLLFGWGSVMLRYYKGLLSVQWAILAVTVAGLLEALGWWIILDLWNRIGQTPGYMVCAAEALTVLKYTCTVAFLALASDGWGVTRDNIVGDKSVNSLVIVCIVFSGAMLAFVRESFVRQRHYYQIPALPFLGPMVVVTLLQYAAVFAWILSKFARMTSEAQSHQLDKLHDVVWRVGAALKLALLLFAFVAGFHLMDIFGFSTISWSVHFAVTDGLQQGIFAMMLAAMMFILWPEQENESQVYLPTSQEDKINSEETTHIIGDEDIDPDVIGARGDEDL